MSGYIADELIDEIRASSDIVSVISDFVRLKKQGRNYTGLCPFHTEKTPSFMVSPEKQIYRCFGCGEGGNVFSFIMKKENLSFPDAARQLAKRAGIEIPEQEDPVLKARLKEEHHALELNELARDFYHYILKNHDTAKEAREYLARRGISQETVDKFQLGFAPPGWDSLLKFMHKKGCSAVKLEKMGLVLPRTKGAPGFYDRFRNRVMFPVWNVQGRVVGFGGRVMDDALPKYLNSPETPVFNKSLLLYGVDKAAENIRRQDLAIVVEGYLDVITCHQAGINNVVASLGTALTREQGKLLLRYSREIVMAYDSDAAGVNATIKGWQLLDDLGHRVRVISIPDGKDPDEFVRNHGAEEFIDIVRNKTMALYEYRLERSLEKSDINTLEGKFKIASEVIPSIRNISNEIEKDEAILKVAQRLHLSPNAVKAEAERKTQGNRPIGSKRDKITGLRDNKSALDKSAPAAKDARAKAEESLLILVLEDCSLLNQVKTEIGIHFSANREYLSIISLLDEMTEKELDYQPAAVFDQIKDEATRSYLSRLLVQEIPSENKRRVFEDCINNIKEDELRRKREELLGQMEEADKNRDQELRSKLLVEYSKLI